MGKTWESAPCLPLTVNVHLCILNLFFFDLIFDFIDFFIVVYNMFKRFFLELILIVVKNKLNIFFRLVFVKTQTFTFDKSEKLPPTSASMPISSNCPSKARLSRVRLG